MATMIAEVGTHDVDNFCQDSFDEKDGHIRQINNTLINVLNIGARDIVRLVRDGTADNKLKHHAIAGGRALVSMLRDKRLRQLAAGLRPHLMERVDLHCKFENDGEKAIWLEPTVFHLHKSWPAWEAELPRISALALGRFDYDNLLSADDRAKYVAAHHEVQSLRFLSGPIHPREHYADYYTKRLLPFSIDGLAPLEPAKAIEQMVLAGKTLCFIVEKYCRYYH